VCIRKIVTSFRCDWRDEVKKWKRKEGVVKIKEKIGWKVDSMYSLSLEGREGKRCMYCRRHLYMLPISPTSTTWAPHPHSFQLYLSHLFPFPLSLCEHIPKAANHIFFVSFSIKMHHFSFEVFGFQIWFWKSIYQIMDLCLIQ